jgi:hypothetical protein
MMNTHYHRHRFAGKRSLILTFTGLLALPLVGCGAGSGMPILQTSGIQGRATEGPISPVQIPGQPNSQTLPNAIITVQPQGGGGELARQTTDAQGNFKIALAPGAYQVVPLPPDPSSPLPRAAPQTVTVPANQFVTITVDYDTGIR